MLARPLLLLFVPCLLSFVVSDPATARAQCLECQVVIKDTAGVARAIAQGENASVTFTAIDDAGRPADGLRVTLTNELDPSDYYNAVFANGTAVFDRVPQGTYVVASNGVAFTDVSIGAASTSIASPAVGSSRVFSLSSGGAVAGAAVIGVGATAIAVSQANKSDGDPNEPKRFPLPPPQLSPSN